MIADTELQMGSEVIWWTVVYILCILKFFFIIVFKLLLVDISKVPNLFQPSLL